MVKTAPSRIKTDRFNARSGLAVEVEQRIRQKHTPIERQQLSIWQHAWQPDER